MNAGFDSRRYQIFWEVVDLERGPLSLVSTIEELLGRKSSVSALERREYGTREPSPWPRGTPQSPNVGTIFAISGCCHSVGIVRLRTQTTEFSLSLSLSLCILTLPYICLTVDSNRQYNRVCTLCKVKNNRHSLYNVCRVVCRNCSAMGRLCLANETFVWLDRSGKLLPALASTVILASDWVS
jgi:hypothetical protein